MSWLRVDDGFTRNRKVFSLTHPAFRLHMTGLCYCAANLTDGLIAASALPMLLAEAQTVKKYVLELEDALLWIGSGPWNVKDYLEYNPSREKVLEERRKAAERQKRWRENNASGNDVTNGVSNAAPARPVPSQPVNNAELPALKSRLGPIDRLLEVLTDSDEGTKSVLSSMALQFRLSEGDFEYARECATGPGVRSPTRVAVKELQKRGKEKVA